jgi:hypothetical protein
MMFQAVCATGSDLQCLLKLNVRTAPSQTCDVHPATRDITVPWSVPPSGAAREPSGPGGALSYDE